MPRSIWNTIHTSIGFTIAQDDCSDSNSSPIDDPCTYAGDDRGPSTRECTAPHRLVAGES